MSAERPDLTQLLARASADRAAGEALLPLVYDELRRVARAQLGGQRADTLQPTALVHEAWMRLVGPEGEAVGWDGRAHFFSAAAQAMRHFLVDRARSSARLKRGGHLVRQPLDAVDAPVDPDEIDFEALDAALTRFAERDERAAKIVELRFFAGLSVEDTASALGVSERTVAREWNVARAWLARELERS
ncbi:MAG: ECF-type sigma factor [Planctomycetota bacterium]